jgi:polysaccharide export outer membrane protein
MVCLRRILWLGGFRPWLPIFIAFLFPATVAFGQGGDYVLSKGDQLLINVQGYSEFTSTTTVKANGTVTLNLIGDVQAAGLTKDEFIGSLQKRLSEYIQGEIKVTVSILSSVGQGILILGGVNRPGNFPIATEVVLLEALSVAGGYVTDANLKKIKVFHKDKRLAPTEIDLEYYIDHSDIENMPKVQPGDMVFVPVRQNFIREFGEFFRDVAFFFALFRIGETRY